MFASTIWVLADFLKVDASYFYDDLVPATAAVPAL